MSSMNRLEIKRLHGYKNIDLRFSDNTLILVGENGAGKTTVLHLLYYLLSGQWSSMAKYAFDEISLTIGAKKHTVRYKDIDESLRDVDRQILRRLPISVRRRFLHLMEQTEGMLVTPELERLCRQYDVPLDLILHQLSVFERKGAKKTDALRDTLGSIHSSLNAQLLYLPTYRRIEEELNLIFKGIDHRELRQRREMLVARREPDTYVELVEFGMKDVEEAIVRTQTELSAFARDSLNKLTFGYLGDIVEEQYSEVDLKKILKASEETIGNILNRIHDQILSSANKQHLRSIIDGVKAGHEPTEHTKVICHYFTKLMAFQEDIERKEANITNFCEVCNEYMVDKEFIYDSSNFNLSICPKDEARSDKQIMLHQLSSGEKQIVSLFSHLHLSGGSRYFVLIDEPELSLSVPWQRRFLVDIKSAEFCTGLVAVTHSPFIYDNALVEYAHGLGEFMQ